MHKFFLVPLLVLSPLALLSETIEEIEKTCLSTFDDPTCASSNKSQIKIQPLAKEDIKHTISPLTEFNTLSQYGIIDYRSAVTWCRKKIFENYHDYDLEIERLKTNPGDFCRKHFIPSIQSKNGNVCEDCDLDPNLILANLLEAIKQSSNSYISEEFYSEEDFIPPTDISENNKSYSDQPEENSQRVSARSVQNNQSVSDKSKENNQGIYFTGSIGVNKVGDIDVKGENSDIEVGLGLGLDMNIGYDFGSYRLEGTWLRANTEKVTWSGQTIETDGTLNSFLASAYYDFRDKKKWSPFIGASIGSAQVQLDGANDYGFTYGIGYGLSYQYLFKDGHSSASSDVIDIFIKVQTMVIPQLEFGSISIEESNYTNTTIGIRYKF